MKVTDGVYINPKKIDGFMKVKYGEDNYFHAVKIVVSGVEFFIECTNTCHDEDEIMMELVACEKGW